MFSFLLSILVSERLSNPPFVHTHTAACHTTHFVYQLNIIWFFVLLHIFILCVNKTVQYHILNDSSPVSPPSKKKTRQMPHHIWVSIGYDWIVACVKNFKADSNRMKMLKVSDSVGARVCVICTAHIPLAFIENVKTRMKLWSTRDRQRQRERIE